MGPTGSSASCTAVSLVCNWRWLTVPRSPMWCCRYAFGWWKARVQLAWCGVTAMPTITISRQLDLRAQDVRIYRVVAGNRTRLESEDELELQADSWHWLKVEHRGTRMRLLINGVPVGEARDRTWQEAGAVGLWTTSDSVAWFDDLTVAPAPPRERGRGDGQD